MRFEKIIMTNYRQYESLVMKFPKREPNDLHVIIASNGIGKTNLLNAIEWCLYGEESHLGSKTNGTLPICNLNAIENAKEKGHSTVTVSVKIFANEDNNEIVIERTVEINPNTLVLGIDVFQVSVNPPVGNTKILQDPEASEFIDTYLPRKIKQYFFFDGEQLYNYFGKNQSTTHVKDSIHEIAQINIVTHLREHLEQTITDKLRTLSNLNPRTEHLQEEYESLKKRKEQMEDDIEKLKASIKEAEDTIEELNIKISGMDSIAEDNEKYNKVLEKIKDLEGKKEELNDEYLAFVRKYYVLLMLYDVNSGTKDFIDDKEQRGHLPPEINKDLIIKSIESGKCAICQQNIGNEARSHLNEFIKQFEVSTSVSNKLMEIKNDTNYSCAAVLKYDEEKKKLYARDKEINGELNDLEEERERLYSKISTCSSVEEIKGWMEQRKALDELSKQNSEKIGSYSEKVERDKKLIALKRAELDNATKGEEKCAALKEQLSLLEDTNIIVKQIEDEIITDVRNRMEKETFDIFSKLIWKKRTYERIELERDYRLRLFNILGYSCLGSCSAAETELLALAFTLALHKVSHHDSLLFIDTPVGRVSDDNRECFAKSLIPISHNKQLILAFTPSEYSEEIEKYFKDSASSFNRLKTEDESATTN